MGKAAKVAGAEAFEDGRLRVENPYDPSSEEWMGWRDGYEQARAFAARMSSGGVVHETPGLSLVAMEPDPMLVRLVYVSVLSPGLMSADIDALVAHSHDANVRRGITGLMALDDDRVCQILEGPGVKVMQLFAKIQKDQRHHDVIDLTTTFIDQRHFGDWGMTRRRMVDVVSLAFTI